MIDPQLLRGVPSLAGVREAGIEDLARVARGREYRAGERIVPLIKPPQQLLFILEGLAKLVGISLGGIERIVYVYRPGDVTDSQVLLEASHEAAYEIVAMEPVRVVTVTRHDFLRVAEDHPELLLAVTREFSRRLEGLTSRMLATMSEEVPVRLGQLLIDFASPGAHDLDEFVPLTHPLTHEAMAQIIGASRPHTSTVLGELEDQGLVQRKSDRGLLVHPARLAQLIRGATTARRWGSGSSP